jgi:hypothetical protein
MCGLPVDVLRGGVGNGDTMDGGAGTEDLLDFSDGTVGVSFTLVQSPSLTSIANGTAGLGNNDSYANMEGVTGTAFNDSITGSTGNDILRGGGRQRHPRRRRWYRPARPLRRDGRHQLHAGAERVQHTGVTASGIGTDQYRNFEGVIGTGLRRHAQRHCSNDVLRGGGATTRSMASAATTASPAATGPTC